MLVGFSFVLHTVFAWWIIFWDGAERVEGWLSALLIDFRAPGWTTREIRFYVGLSWIASVIVLLVRHFS